MTFSICDFVGPKCEQNPLSLSGPVSNSTEYFTEQHIQSTQMILSGVTITYQAATSVELLPNFEIVAGAELIINIADCSGN
jgi:hypothetical protein